MTHIHKLSVTTDSRFNDDIVLHNAKKIVFKPPSAQNQSKISFLHNYGSIGGSSVMTQLVLQDHDHFKIRHQTTGRSVADSQKFYKWKTHINNVSIGMKGNNEDEFEIRHRDRTGNNEWALAHNKNGMTYLNAYKEGSDKRWVEILRDGDYRMGRLKCSVFKPALYIPKGNSTVNEIVYNNINGTTGWNGQKLSKAACTIGLDTGEVVLVKLDEGSSWKSSPLFVGADVHNNNRYLYAYGRHRGQFNYDKFVGTGGHGTFIHMLKNDAHCD
jgi:hypothetical protein